MIAVTNRRKTNLSANNETALGPLVDSFSADVDSHCEAVYYLQPPTQPYSIYLPLDNKTTEWSSNSWRNPNFPVRVNK